MKTRIVTAALLAASLPAFAASGQDAVAAPEFDVASVKPSPPPQSGTMFMTGCRMPDPGRFECQNTPFRMLVVRAFGLDDFRVSAPEWTTSEKFDIAAKVPAGSSPDQVNLMLQKLLADRFGMVAHRETKDLQVYLLTVGKNGPKLTEWKDGDTLPAMTPPPAAIPGGNVAGSVMPMQAERRVVMGGSSGPAAGAATPGSAGSVRFSTRGGVSTMEVNRMKLSTVARMLESHVGHHIVDETGLTGFYNFSLRFAAGESAGSAGVIVTRGSSGEPLPPLADAGSEPAPSIFSAVQNQLGLKLEAKRVLTEVVVVDKAERVPSAN